jgi:hypothetical protein
MAEVNARKNVPSVDGARTPQNNRDMPPWRSTSMFAIDSAPATMPATSVVTFAPASQPAPPGTVNPARASSVSPARCASATAGQAGGRHETQIIKAREPDRIDTVRSLAGDWPGNAAPPPQSVMPKPNLTPLAIGHFHRGRSR